MQNMITVIALVVATSVMGACGVKKESSNIVSEMSQKFSETPLADIQKFCDTNIKVNDAISDALRVCQQRGWSPVFGEIDRVYVCLISAGGQYNHKIVVKIYVDNSGKKVSGVKVTESYTYL